MKPVTCPCCNGKGTLPTVKTSEPKNYTSGFAGTIQGEHYEIMFNDDGTRFFVKGPDDRLRAAIAWTVTGGNT